MADPRDVVRRAYELFKAGDVPRMTEECLTEDVIWEEAGAPDAAVPLFTCSTRGKKKVAEYLLQLVQKVGLTELHTDALCVGETGAAPNGGTHVVMLGGITLVNLATGAKCDYPLVHVWEVGAEGKVLAFKEHSDTARMERVMAAA